MRQRLFALLLYVVMLLFVIVTAPLMVRGPRKIAELIPDGLPDVLAYGYYPALLTGLISSPWWSCIAWRCRSHCRRTG